MSQFENISYNSEFHALKFRGNKEHVKREEEKAEKDLLACYNSRHRMQLAKFDIRRVMVIHSGV